jgi:hypothetical protein
VEDRLASLPDIEAEVWRQLALAGQDRQHEWHTPVLATVRNGAADARTVVLREVDSLLKQFLIYTDARSAKVGQLQRHPQGMLVMWSSRLGWQLRCSVTLALEPSGLSASSRWARIKLTPAAQDYLSPLPPGTPVEWPAAPAHDPVARDHFAVIEAQVLAIDWLELHEQGHRRALLDAVGARWVQP